MKESIEERRMRFEREEKQKKERQDLMNKCKASIRNDITVLGYRPVLLQYEYLKATPSLKTGFDELTRGEVYECYEYVFENHKSK
jgi:hypothetical protein